MKLLINIKIHDSFKEFLTGDIMEELLEIERQIGSNITPSAYFALRFLEQDIDEIKVAIIGQDPYPQVGVATGRAFEVGGLKSWNDTFRQSSLKNIVRLLYKNYNYINDYQDIPKYNYIKSKIKNEEFKILPPDELFKNWESQGVLLLNSTYTLIPGKSNSHEKIWSKFSDEVIKYISTRNENIKWFLWGNFSINKGKNVENSIKYECKHPMMCSSKKENDFLKSNCFKDTMDEINWLGKEK